MPRPRCFVRASAGQLQTTSSLKSSVDPSLLPTALLYISRDKDLTAFESRLSSLSPCLAMSELLQINADRGDAALHHILSNPCASLHLLSSIASIKPTSISPFAVKTFQGAYPLHFCAYSTPDVAVLQFVIDRFPHALVRGTCGSARRTPLERAAANKGRNAYDAIVACLVDNMARYPALLNKITVKLCLVRMKRGGATKTVGKMRLNDMTPGQFVFMVLDEMVNREMKPLADEILSYVGTNVPLTSPTKFEKIIAILKGKRGTPNDGF